MGFGLAVVLGAGQLLVAFLEAPFMTILTLVITIGIYLLEGAANLLLGAAIIGTIYGACKLISWLKN